MVFEIKGKAKIKEKLSNSSYFWGEESDITGKVLPVLDRNKYGDCLCVVEGKGLVDVDHTDIEYYTHSARGFMEG